MWGTQKGLVMSSAMVIVEIMIMNMIPFFILCKSTLNLKGQRKAQRTQWRVPE